MDVDVEAPSVSVPDVSGSVPDISGSVPEMAVPEVSGTLPDVSGSLPEVSGDVSAPDVSGDASMPDVSGSLPDASMPDVSGSLPSGSVDASMPSVGDVSADVEAKVDDIAAKVPDMPSVEVKKPKKGLFGGIFSGSKGKIEVRRLSYRLWMRRTSSRHAFVCHATLRNGGSSGPTF